ncbi:phosphatidylinositol N-acetylglucosaminyltransferase subunit P-like isoform X2 [Phragmites australis]|uniref:phosphatidylinositol N-acetylglucosaminyltransferase subunit P-like isoform X2 n=1 Tax=Phragmites australis TaxID=29695 RepID=UPI002D7979D1|nr:phosphatidylinositol N-acetylglucosaminyltransferase subunit P-like isoform X2 [Phragmites australis]
MAHFPPWPMKSKHHPFRCCPRRGGEEDDRVAAAADDDVAVAGGAQPKADGQPPPQSPPPPRLGSLLEVSFLRRRDHGPKPSEVYGFVGSITTVISTAVYLAWDYTPEPWLRSLGITYYPSKYWALAVPSFVIVVVALSMVIYMGFNFLATPPPTSFNTIFDENSRERVTFSPAMEADSPIEPISDIKHKMGDTSNMKKESTSSKLLHMERLLHPLQRQVIHA